MEDTFFLTSIDWASYEQLRAAASSSFVRARLEGAIRSVSFDPEPDAARLLSAYENVGIAAPVLLYPLGLRVDRDRYVAPTLDWLESLDPAVLNDALLELARGAIAMESGIESTILLSYFSPAYRPIATGLEEGFRGREGRYDGPDALRRAVGGYLFPDRKETVVYSPAETRAIADELDAIDLADYPIGDLSWLARFVATRADDSPPVEDTCRAHFISMRDTYRTAADRGFGMRVFP